MHHHWPKLQAQAGADRRHAKLLQVPTCGGMLQHGRIFVIGIALCLCGCGKASSPLPEPADAVESTVDSGRTLTAPSALEADPAAIVAITWDDLVPEQWRPERLMARFAAADLEDDDPRATALWNELETLWREAPVVAVLDGRDIELAGFLVPLEMDTDSLHEFLLVPYYGACIHMPPPPANQTIHVVLPQGITYRSEAFDSVSVRGRLRVTEYASDLAAAGYRLDARTVVPYE